ncbi:PAS domain-containing sensor histidine kinase [Methanolobus sp. ZRKC3]|uniref:sensor histidine kinase n=1 Tax=Methanolobus sp. ZRKC3 TaxID=3125786 RepID=UPI00324EBB6B
MVEETKVSCCSGNMNEECFCDSTYAPMFTAALSFEEIENARPFFNLINSPIMVIDADKNILLANSKFESLLGYDETEIEDEDWMELFIPRGLISSFDETISAVLSTELELSEPLEHELITKNGDELVLTWNITKLKGKDENIKGLIFSGTDVTVKDKAEKKALHEKEAIFSFLSSATYAIILSDSSGKITFWNKKASQLFGYDEAEIIGEPLSVIMPKRYRKAHEGWDQLISIGKSQVMGRIFEVTGLRKDGSEFPLELSITTTRKNGQVFHSAILNDISKRKMKERMTTISKNKYRMIFEKSPLGIFHFDENGVVTQCNEKFVNIVGAEEGQVISSIIGFNLLTSFSDNSIKKAVKQVLAGLPARYEDTFVSPFSDRSIPIKAEFSPVISDEGKLMGGVCVIEDFTERKSAEEALNKYAEDLANANEELKSLDKMKDEFLSNLRHELKTPLIPIKGYSELMFDGSLGELTDKQRDAMGKVMLSSERLKRLIDSLLYVSITEAGSMEFSFVPLRLSEVVASALLDRSPELASKRHTVEKNFPDDLPLIEGDLDSLQDALVNVIDNAVKFTPDGGTISISAIKEDDRIHLRITDDGIGIPEKSLPNVFERFYQADGSSTRKYGGNGLGLYVCQKIIEAHRGGVWAESKEGKYTTIHVILPVKELSSPSIH